MRRRTNLGLSLALTAGLAYGGYRLDQGCNNTDEIDPAAQTAPDTEAEGRIVAEIPEVIEPSIPEPSCEEEIASRVSNSISESALAIIVDCQCNNDCSTLAQIEEYPCNMVTVYPDADGDRFTSNFNQVEVVCSNEIPVGYTLVSRLHSTELTDCDDNNENIHPSVRGAIIRENQGFPLEGDIDCDPNTEHFLSEAIASILDNTNLPAIDVRYRTRDYLNNLPHVRNWAEEIYQQTRHSIINGIPSTEVITSEITFEIMMATTEDQRISLFRNVAAPIIERTLINDPDLAPEEVVEILDHMISYTSTLDLAAEQEWLIEASNNSWRENGTWGPNAFVNFGPGTENLAELTYEDREPFRRHEAWVVRQVVNERISQENVLELFVEFRNNFVRETNLSIEPIVFDNLPPTPIAPSQTTQPLTPTPTAPSQATQPLTPTPTTPSQATQPLTPTPIAPSQATQPLNPTPTAPSQATQPLNPTPTAPSQAEPANQSDKPE